MGIEESTLPILPLPPQVAAQIKSSNTVPSVASVALGLVSNSIDAEASKISVSIDFSRGGILVEDDGVGIHPKEFGDNGGLGKLHREHLGMKFVHVILTTLRHLQTQ